MNKEINEEKLEEVNGGDKSWPVNGDKGWPVNHDKGWPVNGGRSWNVNGERTAEDPLDEGTTRKAVILPRK